MATSEAENSENTSLFEQISKSYEEKITAFVQDLDDENEDPQPLVYALFRVAVLQSDEMIKELDNTFLVYARDTLDQVINLNNKEAAFDDPTNTGLPN